MTAEHEQQQHHSSTAQPRVSSSSTAHSQLVDHAAAAAYALPFQTGAAASSSSSSNSRGFEDAAAAHYGHEEAFAQLIQRAIRMGEGAATAPPPPASTSASTSTSSVAAAAAAAIAAVAPVQEPQPGTGATRDPAQVHLELIRKRLEAAEKSTPPPAEQGIGGTSSRDERAAGETGIAFVETGPAATATAAADSTAAPFGAARSPSSQSPLPATTPAATAPAATAATGESTNTTTTTTTPTTTSKPGRGPGSRARWTPAEDRKLVQFVHYSDPPLTWDEIGAKMGRAATGCSMRWYKYLRDKSTPPAANRESLLVSCTSSHCPSLSRRLTT